jgi:hydrogenase maturation protein HypF
MVELIAAACRRIRESSGVETVVLSGGVFMNVLLTSETIARLKSEKFQVFRHCQMPPNDGGLSFGQLAVAAAFDHQSDARASAGSSLESSCASQSPAK